MLVVIPHDFDNRRAEFFRGFHQVALLFRGNLSPRKSDHREVAWKSDSTRSALLSGSEFIEAIQACNFVSFGKCRIIEDRIAKIIHGAAEGQDGLADVHDFRGAFSDDVDTEDFACVRMEENFQHAGVIADDLRLGQLFIF